MNFTPYGMKSHRAITRLGRLRRFRILAKQVLKVFGLKNARLTFLTYEGNVMYRVDTKAISKNTGLYCPGRYLLRVHMDYHSAAAIESELHWLTALRRDADLPVPEPICGSNGEMVIDLPVPGDSDISRKCSILKWVDGRFLLRRLAADHVREWGRLMAHLHLHSARWKRPKSFTRPRRDWDGLFSDAAGFDHPAEELWQAIPKRFIEPFNAVSDQANRVMKQLGKRSDAFGLIHADLMINTNILFRNGQARAIDFDDCCFGYWMHDLSFALSSWQGTDRERWIRDIFLNGYSEVRTLPDSQLKHLDLFLAVFNANLMLWMIDWAKSAPNSTRPRKFIDKYGSNLKHYVER